MRVDIHANIDSRSVFGSGARFEFAVVPDGFIGGNVHDELALSFGADVFFAPLYWGDNYYSGGAYVVPIGAVHVGFNHDEWYDKHGHGYGWAYATPDVGFGARYHFNSHVALLLKLSTPGGAQVGIVF